MMQEGVDERPARVARRRMNDQAGGLVEDDEVGIFVGDVEGDGFREGKDGVGGWNSGHNPIPRAERRPRFDLLSVQMDKAVFDKALDRGAGPTGGLGVACKKKVNPLPCVLPLGHKLVDGFPRGDGFGFGRPSCC